MSKIIILLTEYETYDRKKQKSSKLVMLEDEKKSGSVIKKFLCKITLYIRFAHTPRLTATGLTTYAN